MALTRREQIVDAAASLFAEHGFHGVGVDDLGAAVGISGPAVYRHFPGKDAVLSQMLLDVSTRLRDEGQRRVRANADDPRKALAALVEAHVDFALDNPAVITVYDRDLGAVPDPERRRIRRLQREYVEQWVDVVVRIRPEHDQRTARVAVLAVFGLMNSTPHSARDLSRGDLADLLNRMAVAALVA